MGSLKHGVLAAVAVAGLFAMGCSTNAGPQVQPGRSVAMLEEEEDAGASDPSFVTDTPEGWLERCASPVIASQLDECAELPSADGTDAERLAFRMNLRASDEKGILPPGLGSLHFSHGRYTGWRIEELAQAIDQSLEDDDVLNELVIAVNRSFLDGMDSGALAEWVETPLCGGADLTVEGPASARCGLLDAACTRGRYQEAGSCCTIELQPAGTWCGDHAVCTPDGRCAVDENLPPFDRVAGPISWVDVLSGGNPFTWYLSAPRDDSVRVAVVADGDMQPGPEPDPNTPLEQWKSQYGGRFGFPVAELRQDAVGGLRGRVGKVKGAVLAAAVHAEDHVEALYVANAPAEVCVIRGRSVDELGPVLSDCSMPGAVAIACPGEDGGISCEHNADGFAVVRADEPDLALAFAKDVQPGQTPVDVWPHLFPERVCAGYGCARLLGGDMPVLVVEGIPNQEGVIGGPGTVPDAADRESCPIDGECQGFRFCLTWRGAPSCGVCIRWPETCNGTDDDCDGTVDETGDALCDDATRCTDDWCDGTNGCQHEPARSWLLDHGASRCSDFACEFGICLGEPGAEIHPEWRRTAEDENGCAVAYRDEVCEDADNCSCNGRSVCDPATAAATDRSVWGQVLGCTDQGPLATPASEWPCEASGDGNACTHEICCENAACHHLLFGTTPSGTTQIRPPDDPLCSLPIGLEFRAGDGAVPGATAAQCVPVEQLLSRSDREAWFCNDERPCTVDKCEDRTLGTCSHRYPGNLGLSLNPPPKTIQLFFGDIAVGDPIALDRGCRGDGTVEGRDGMGVIEHGCAYQICTSDYECTQYSTPGTTGSGAYGQCTNDERSGECGWRHCAGRRCVSEPNHSQCPETDGKSCTQPRCTESSSTFVCSEPLVPGFCLIDGVNCVAAGAPNPEDRTCEVCDPARSTSRYSLDIDNEECGPDGRPGQD